MSFRKLVRRLLEDFGWSDSKVEISSPMNFEHRVHVFLDETGRYIGLPPQWADLIGNKARRKVRRTESSPDMLAAKRRNAALRRTDSSDPRPQNSRRREDFAGSLDKPRSRISVADDQDLIIERLKRELRDYKTNHPAEFNTMLGKSDSAAVDRALTLGHHEYQNGGGTSWQFTSHQNGHSRATKTESAV